MCGFPMLVFIRFIFHRWDGCVTLPSFAFRRLYCLSISISLCMCVCMFVSTGRCKTNFNSYSFVYTFRKMFFARVYATLRWSDSTALDLKLIYVYFQTWNMAPLFFVYFYVHIYFRHAICLSFPANTHKSNKMGIANKLLNKSMNYHFMKLKLTSTIYNGFDYCFCLS